MSTKRLVVLDADGTQGMDAVVLIGSATGVVYNHQCGGHWCYQRQAEGYLVPLGDATLERELVDFFGERFAGDPPSSGSTWVKNDLAALDELVHKTRIWDDERPPGERWTNLQLDLNRLDELTEAWVPVDTALGRGTLLFKNSD